MTIPTRPAPPPPQARNFNGSAAAADANASLEQLRLQLQQQQQQQKITIKLPPPPKGNLTNNSTTFPMKSNFNNNASNSNHFDFDSQIVGSTSSITRKFPKARYAPTTNWDDAPFEAPTTNTTVAKKVPPPRPPPPKVLVNGQQTKSTTTTSTNILTNIFHRKKSSSTTATTTTKSTANNNKLAKQNSAARVYGLSSGKYASTTQSTSSSSSSTTTTTTTAATYDAGLNNVDWNAAWNSTTTTTSNGNSYYATTTTTSSSSTQDAQLISFDSPPSSPTFTQKSNSDCLSVDSFSSDSNFSSPQNGSVSQPESGFEDDFSANGSQQSRSRPATTSPMDPWETFDAFGNNGGAGYGFADNLYCSTATIGTAPVRNLNTLNTLLRTNGQAHPQSQDNPLCNGKSLLPPAPAVQMPTIIKPKISQKPKAPKPPAFNHIKQFQKHQSESSSSSSSSTDLPTPPSPPMPQCAPPPPPPSILDVISGKVDALQLAGNAYNTNAVDDDDSPPYGIALYDFDGAEEGDLCFREGEKIYLLEQASNEWYRGRTRAGCEGLLPANYIDVKVPLKLQNGTSDTTAPATAIKTQHTLPKVRCLYDFPAEIEGDLALKENDMVTILYRINEDWLFGEMNNRQGQFPANFLEYIPPNIPLP